MTVSVHNRYYRNTSIIVTTYGATMRRVHAVVAAMTAGAAMALSGCSATSTGQSSAKLSGSVHVLAPATMTMSLPMLDKQFTGAHSGVSAKPDIGHSPEQVTALHEGEPGDVFITTGAQSMTQAKQDGLLASSPVTFARNKLEIVVAKGNPKHITSLADLAKKGVTVVLSSQMMPVGGYAMTALSKAHVMVHPASMEMGSPDIVNKVALGDADAGIVFVTDLGSGGSKVQGVQIPAADQVTAPYEAAVLKGASSPAAAQAYVASLNSPSAQTMLRKQGFMAP